MKIKPLHPNFQVPTKGTDQAGAYDIYMPTSGALHFGSDEAVKVPLGFAAEVPEGHVALLLPRSSAGAKKGLELNNTCGVIDADYRGEWIAFLRIKNSESLHWDQGERLLQVLIVPAASVNFEVVDELSSTDRGEGGFGSTN
ncbi:MAG: dUTP diphosphatase [Gammaproteobacteria bacterium]|nr:MAG: dUTP diphosphatase [Gammaproteobacteria bacterium]